MCFSFMLFFNSKLKNQRNNTLAFLVKSINVTVEIFLFAYTLNNVFSLIKKRFKKF